MAAAVGKREGRLLTLVMAGGGGGSSCCSSTRGSRSDSSSGSANSPPCTLQQAMGLHTHLTCSSKPLIRSSKSYACSRQQQQQQEQARGVGCLVSTCKALLSCSSSGSSSKFHGCRCLLVAAGQGAWAGGSLSRALMPAPLVEHFHERPPAYCLGDLHQPLQLPYLQVWRMHCGRGPLFLSITCWSGSCSRQCRSCPGWWWSHRLCSKPAAAAMAAAAILVVMAATAPVVMVVAVAAQGVGLLCSCSTAGGRLMASGEALAHHVKVIVAVTPEC